MPNLTINSLKALAVRMMVSLLARWGYTVSFREPLILSVEHTLDRRAIELGDMKPDDLRALVERRSADQLARALLERGLIDWLSYEVPEYMQRRYRGTLRFFPVVPR